MAVAEAFVSEVDVLKESPQPSTRKTDALSINPQMSEWSGHGAGQDKLSLSSSSICRYRILPAIPESINNAGVAQLGEQPSRPYRWY